MKIKNNVVVVGLISLLITGCSSDKIDKSQKEVIIVQGVENEGECTKDLIDSVLYLLRGTIESAKYSAEKTGCYSSKFNGYKRCQETYISYSNDFGSCIGIIAPEQQ